MQKETISDIILSSKFYKKTDDSLKDEDNVGWVMELSVSEIREWATILKWVRVADRLLENDILQKSSKKQIYTFKNFLSEWKILRKGKTPVNSPFSTLFEELKERWDRESLSEKDLKVWDLYLESLEKYAIPETVIRDMKEYKKALYGLSGTFFQAFPFAPKNLQKEIGVLGMLDQFYNNLRDLYEDTVRGVCYFPRALLSRFEISRNNMDLLVSTPDNRFSNMVEFMLSKFAIDLKEEMNPLLSSKDLHHSWKVMLKHVLHRYERIERVFRLCNYNAKQFNFRYWDFVRADIDPKISLKFQLFKSTLRF